MDRANQKLQEFLDKKLFKKAELGTLENVMSIEDIKKFSPMLSEMIELPKYKPTIDKLRVSSGLVNFVTRDGYSPLIESILKAAFPLNNNDIFSTVDMEVTDKSFAIGSGFFGTVHDPKGTAIPSAISKMSELVEGSETLLTRDWLKQERSMSDDNINRIYGTDQGGGEQFRFFDDALITEWMEQRDRAIREARETGERPAIPPPPREVLDSNAPAARLGWEMACYEFELKKLNERWDAHINGINQEIEGYAVAGQDAVAGPGEEQLRGLRYNKQMYLNMRAQESRALRDMYFNNLNPPTVDKMKGLAGRNKDGFINYNPAKPILQKSRDLLGLVKDYDPVRRQKPPPGQRPIGQRIQEIVNDLRNDLRNYRSTDPNMARVVNEFLQKIGNGDPDDLFRVKQSLFGSIALLQRTLTDTLIKHGKVMIFDEFDKTVLCQLNEKSGSTTIHQPAKQILSKFVSENQANISKDVAPMSKKERGNRILILMSSESISNLPAGSSIVELDASPVNPEEADIIIKYCVEEKDKEKNAYLRIRKYEGAEGKHQEALNKAYQDFKANENEKTRKAYEDVVEKMSADRNKASLSPREQESLVSDSVKKRMASYISGLNVRDAIQAARTTLEYSITTREGNDVLKPQVKCDIDKLVKTLREDVNRRIQTDVLGVKLEHASVTFDEYAYKKTSKWAKKVQAAGRVKMSLESTNERLNLDRVGLKEIDEILDSGVDKNGKPINEADEKWYASKRRMLAIRIAGNEQKRLSMGANNLPHIYLLWGKPGVGKSIWADALANLFDLTIVDVDITAQFDKWVGSSGKNARGLLNMMGNSKSTVFLIDEIDRQVDSGSKKNAVKQDPHETTKQVVYQFLQFFEKVDNKRKFKANEVFFIMTSNHEDCIDKAWLQRTGNGFYEVELPDDPEDYKMFFKSFMNVERSRFPEYPWLQDPREVALLNEKYEHLPQKERDAAIAKAGWDTTFRIINEELDWGKIAKEFAGRRIDFRTLSQILTEAYSAHMDWQVSMEEISASANPKETAAKIGGLPLTTENLMEAAKFARTSEEENRNFNLGIPEIMMRKHTQVAKMLESINPAEFVQQQGLDPYGEQLLEELKKIQNLPPKVREEREREIRQTYGQKTTALPAAILEYMSRGTVPFEDEPEIPITPTKYTETPTGQGRVKAEPELPVPGKTIDQEVEELTDESFEGEERLPGAPKVKPEEDDETVKSSTDYYYKFLKKKGVLNNKGEIVRKEARQNLNKPVQSQYIPEKDKEGELFYEGFVMIVKGPGED